MDEKLVKVDDGVVRRAVKNMEPLQPSQAKTVYFGGTNETIEDTTRFNSSILILVSVGLICIFLNALTYNFQSYALLIFVGIASTFVGFFFAEWYGLHGGAMSRIRRAFFDEANVIKTHKARDREFGHLFQPDPPTPGVLGSSWGAPPLNIQNYVNMVENDEQKEFNKSVLDHYAGMHDVIKKSEEQSQAVYKAAAAADFGREEIGTRIASYGNSEKDLQHCSTQATTSGASANGLVPAPFPVGGNPAVITLPTTNKSPSDQNLSNSAKKRRNKKNKQQQSPMNNNADFPSQGKKSI